MARGDGTGLYLEDMGRPSSLDIVEHTLRSMMLNIPMFKNVSRDLLRRVCICLELEVYVPGLVGIKVCSGGGFYAWLDPQTEGWRVGGLGPLLHSVGVGFTE